MAGSTRIKGAALILSLGTPPVEVKCDITSYKITNDEKESDVTTFCDVAEGDDRQFKLQFSAIQSTDAESLWMLVWSRTGEEDVAYTVAPHGNAVPSVTQPHFTGTLTIGSPPELGGDAGKTTEFTFDAAWEIDGKPTLDTGA